MPENGRATSSETLAAPFKKAEFALYSRISRAAWYVSCILVAKTKSASDCWRAIDFRRRASGCATYDKNPTPTRIASAAMGLIATALASRTTRFKLATTAVEQKRAT